MVSDRGSLVYASGVRRSRKTARWSVIAVVVGIGLAACSEDLGLDDLVFACASDADCARGTRCDPIERVCRVPRLDAGTIDPECGFEESSFNFTDDRDRWSFLGGAHVIDEVVRLTPEQAGIRAGRGMLWTLERYPATRFTFEMDFTIGGGNGADGMAMAWISDGPYAEGWGGPRFGIGGLTGFYVEVDTFTNTSFGDPARQHIALGRTSSTTDVEHIAISGPVKELRNTETPLRLRLELDQGAAEIYLDDALVLTASIANYQPFEATFGAGAGTGGSWDEHVVHRLALRCAR